MSTLINLEDLLKHEIMDLYSAEEQIIEALPKMIENANNTELKNALSTHLKVTKAQKSRLDQVKKLIGTPDTSGEEKGFFSRLFSGSDKCRGTEGLIEEGEKMMKEDMSPEVRDAAIIAGTQKIEHYEISGYGTARAFARELNLPKVVALLEETLNEEYAADVLLTKLAVGRLNLKAEQAIDTNGSNVKRSSASSSKKSGTNSTKSGKSGSLNNRGNTNSSSGRSAFSKAKSKPSTSSSNGRPTAQGSSNKSSSGGRSAAGTAAKSSSGGRGTGSKAAKSTSRGRSETVSSGASSKGKSSATGSRRSGSSKSVASKSAGKSFSGGRSSASRSATKSATSGRGTTARSTPVKSSSGGKTSGSRSSSGSRGKAAGSSGSKSSGSKRSSKR